MAAYVIVGVEHPGDVLRQVAVQDGLDVVTMVDCGESIGKRQALCSCIMKTNISQGLASTPYWCITDSVESV